LRNQVAGTILDNKKLPSPRIGRGVGGEGEKRFRVGEDRIYQLISNSSIPRSPAVLSFLLVIAVLLVSSLFTSIFILTPVNFLAWLHLPSWTGLVVLGLFVAWCLGE